MSTIYTEAQKKARYGHKDWLVWTPQGKEQKSAKLDSRSIKQCLLEMGTQGKFSIIHASTAITMRGSWRIGINVLNQCKHGIR